MTEMEKEGNGLTVTKSDYRSSAWSLRVGQEKRAGSPCPIKKPRRMNLVMRITASETLAVFRAFNPDVLVSKFNPFRSVDFVDYQFV